jgi:hypothetical protein
MSSNLDHSLTPSKGACMLSDIIVGSALLICVGAFATTNLRNILVVHRRRTEEESSAEIRRPSGVAVGIAALATFLLFLETVHTSCADWSSRSKLYAVELWIWTVAFHAIHWFGSGDNRLFDIDLECCR